MCEPARTTNAVKEEEIVLRFTKTEALALRELLRSARSLQWKLRDALEPPPMNAKCGPQPVTPAPEGVYTTPVVTPEGIQIWIRAEDVPRWEAAQHSRAARNWSA